MIRLNNGSCTIDAGVLYLDLLTNLERISDHSTNIVKQVLKLKQNIVIIFIYNLNQWEVRSYR